VPEQENVELVGERKFTGKLKTTTPLPSDAELRDQVAAGTVDTWSMVHDSVAGRIVTINGRSQLVDPDYSRDQRRRRRLDGPMELVPSSLTTDDDLAIVLT
jgi:hypothetical protein